MITPKFKVTQTEECLVTTIHAPYANIQELYIFVEEKEIIFIVSPYYLRLYLPHKLQYYEEQGCEHGEVKYKEIEKISKYDAQTGDYVLTTFKKFKGEHFPDLDMITLLLTPHSKRKEKTGSSGEDCSSGDSSEENEQKQMPAVTATGVPYGFARTKSMIFTKLQSELNSAIDLQDPDLKDLATRKHERIDNENMSFSHEHYLFDFYMPDVRDCLEFTTNFSSTVELTEPENMILTLLPKVNCTPEGNIEREVYLGLCDILLSYCYNHRINEGDDCCESSWNYSKLSATLSWLEVFESEEEVLLAFMRRSMIFPLYRNWKLSLKIVKDTIDLLRCGKVQVLKCLLEMYSSFRGCDERYVMNTLYMTPYCCWIQGISNEKLLELATNMEKVQLRKGMLELRLQFWEKVSADSDESDSESSGSDESEDENSCSDESEDENSSSDESEDENSCSDESENENSGSDESENENSGSDESENENSDSDESENENSGSDESENENSCSDECGNENSCSDECENENSGSDESENESRDFNELETTTIKSTELEDAICDNKESDSFTIDCHKPLNAIGESDKLEKQTDKVTD